jgi:galactokinase
MTTVETYFGGQPAVQASAPGRVNLLGEHTDYNDGFVLPIATPQRTHVALGHSPDEASHLYSATLRQNLSFRRGDPVPAGFGQYIEGCFHLLEESGITVPPLKVHIRSDVPMGSGLSSSAALEIAMLRALRTLLGLALDDASLALLGQQAEVRFAHVNCGIMDQMASSLADSRHMLFLDTRTLTRRLLPLPDGAELIVIDSGVARTLATSKYNERRAQCEEAARQLGVKALRDVADAMLVEHLPEPYRSRARHVVHENNRVLEASRGTTAERFGELMNDSHASLRDDYEVSIAELDTLTMLLRQHPEVFGARLTGAGFGGACVALCRPHRASAIAAETLARYNQSGRQGRVLLPVVQPG